VRLEFAETRDDVRLDVERPVTAWPDEASGGGADAFDGFGAKRSFPPRKRRELDILAWHCFQVMAARAAGLMNRAEAESSVGGSLRKISFPPPILK